MKRKIGSILIFCSFTAAQSQKIAKETGLELRYPLLLSEIIDYYGYSGLIDVSVDYNFLCFEKFSISLRYNNSWMTNRDSKIPLYIVSPKIKINYNIVVGNQVMLVPHFGVGYSFFLFRGEGMVRNELGEVVPEKYKQNEHGFSLIAGTKLRLNNTQKRVNWYFLLCYEYTKLKIASPYINNKKGIQILFPGIGANIKLGAQ